MRVSISRLERFNAVHRLYRPEWSDEKNLDVFGKCSYPNYHGHNYDLIVTLIGEQDPVTGFVYDLKKLGHIIREHVIQLFDHKNLNVDTTHFQQRIPTTENVAIVIWQILREKIEPHIDIKIRLHETEKNYVEYPA